MELRKAWCAATAHPSYQKDWTEDNPSYGQCCVTALTMQDLYGGDIYECKVHGKRHYVNITPEGYLHDFYRMSVWRRTACIFRNETKNKRIVVEI